MARSLTRRSVVAGATALLFVSGIAALNSAAAVAQGDPRGRQIFKTRDGIALAGYDVVAYFSDNRAVKGNTRFRHERGSAVWLFAGARNLQTLKRDPARFLPQYGGYGAIGITRGAIEYSDPENFVVIDGKFYLHASSEHHQMFESNRDRNIQFANINWERIRTVINR